MDVQVGMMINKAVYNNRYCRAGFPLRSKNTYFNLLNVRFVPKADILSTSSKLNPYETL